MTRKPFGKIALLLLILLIAAYASLYFMAQRSPGPGDKAWRDKIEQNNWSKVANINGGALHYLEAGKGRPILLIHGYADSSYTWHKNFEFLIKNGFHVIAVDLPGMGLSDPPPENDYSPASLAGVIIAFLDEKKLDRVNIIGSSLGGSLALYIAQRHNGRVDKLIPVDPACYPNGQHEFFGKAASSVLFKSLIKPVIGPWIFKIGLRKSYHNPDLISGRLASQKTRPFVRPDYADNLIEMGAGYFLSPSYGKSTRAYTEISAPTLLVWGETDWLVNTDKNAERLQKEIKGSRLEIIKEAGHLPHQEKSNIFNNLIIDFLSLGAD